MRFITFVAALLPLASALPAFDGESSHGALEQRNYKPTCGVNGYNKAGRPHYHSVSYKCDRYECHNICQKSSKCQSYSVSNGACRLYSSKVVKNCATSSKSPYKYYDKSCACPPKPNKPKTTTTKKSSTTTKKTSTTKATTTTANDVTSTTSAVVSTTTTAASTTTTNGVTTTTTTPVITTTSTTTNAQTTTTTATTTTTTAVLPPSVCGGFSPERVSTPDEVDYARYFSGIGRTLNPAGPYNEDPENSPPITTYIVGTSTTEQAALECATQAYDNGYFTIDLHFRLSRGAWECVQYLDVNEGTDSSDPASFYNVQDLDVACSFGYTLDFPL
ncbi:hypothetical protein CB0940_03561 [Cercospora beticola]|uniref:Apple domain-containing protein n=1 Tax=Cercospora beticola TaxID=122368 RepID=A0A2G5I2T2_CERBT|nr:hypothetical protein CB0940_03561 [Cercospora beticola]PIA99116.1 hypothetical protein CB0940_03561 [Cercospora beticola]WPB00737.1 hypothetical protein RHO25_005357 [Cercospora beticola]